MVGRLICRWKDFDEDASNWKLSGGLTLRVCVRANLVR